LGDSHRRLCGFLFIFRMKGILILAGLATLVSAQVPGLGWCPEYASMADFDLDRVSLILIIILNFCPFLNIPEPLQSSVSK